MTGEFERDPARVRRVSPEDAALSPALLPREPKLRPASGRPLTPEPLPEGADDNHILDVMNNRKLVMGRSPTVFAEMGEEDIRQHYLLQLNGHLRGAGERLKVQLSW